MCDLLGLTFTTNITANISLNLFQEHGMKNPDGWGLAYYQDKRLQVIKEVKASNQSSLYDFVENSIYSKTIISHVRRSTRGLPSYLNTHPFYRRLVVNDIPYEYAFAHNGTLTDFSNPKSAPITPIGETDSEQAFCYILNDLSSQIGFHWDLDGFNHLEYVLRDINDGQNTINCIFSDGEHLFCYSDENDYNNGLRYVKREYPFGKIELVGQEYKLGSIDISNREREVSRNFPLSGFIISTKILTNEHWTEFSGGELIVFKEGRIVFPLERI
ncbi:class II glutamine amidotransferase [Candidatus Thorarchaeota archaeon]|nr:MAG: class II glutamine amidotransferase [Candidatus Thorarchaeota archaeon]